MRIKHILSFSFILVSITLSSQNYLGISKVITGFIDTVNVNQSVSYKVYVKNYGPATFTGYFRLNTWVDSTNATHAYHFSRLDTLFSPVTINVGDSIPFNTGDTYDLATYRVTGNVVVIWPKTFNPGWQIKDSVFHPVFVRGLAGLKEFESFEKQIVIYPNPVSSTINFEYNSQSFFVEDVRILNNIGQCVKEFKPLNNSIPISELDNGIYIIEFNSSKGKLHKRFIKE